MPVFGESDVEVELVLKRSRLQASLIDLAALQVDPRLDEILGEHVTGRQEVMVLFERIEGLAPQLMRDVCGITKPICANIDLYTGFIYKMLGVPETLFTPLFAVARMAGWSAHRMEELFCAHRIIRPTYRPVIEPLEYKPLADR